MRQLTHNQIVELQACKRMDNPQMEFFSRIEKMMDGDEEALAEIKKLLDQYLSINEILKSNPAAFGAEQKSKANYYQAMDEFLAKVGYEEYDPAEEMEMKKAKKGILEILNEWYGKKY